MQTLPERQDARQAAAACPRLRRDAAPHSAAMPVRSLFATRLYEAEHGNAGLLADLAHSIRTLAQDDHAGRRWSRIIAMRATPAMHRSTTCRGAIRRSPILRRLLARHAAKFAEDCAFDLRRKPKLDSLWVNLLRGGGHHSGHIHPHSIISGTLYVEVPAGSGAIRFEDPRLPLMMAAPQRSKDAAEELQTS